MDAIHEPLTPERRTMLGQKGRTLYGKYCGTGGRGICAESFAVYHLDKGEFAPVHDLLAFLKRQIEQLRHNDPDGRLAMTMGLAERICKRIDQAYQSWQG